MIHRVASAIRRAGAIAVERPGTGLWTVLALACALFVVGIAVIAAASVDRWAGAHPPGGGNLVVYLDGEIDDARARALTGELRALRGVERAELVSAAESAARLTRALGADPALLDGVEHASLPASIEVRLAPGVREVVALSPTVRALRGAPGVAELVVEDAGDDRVPGVLATARGVAWSGAALLAVLAIVIVVAAVRVRCERSAHHAAVLRMLGASPGFLAIPNALAGALQGIVAAGLAAGTLALTVAYRPGPLAQLALDAPSAGAFAALLALGGVVGLAGGGLAGVARAR